jgi:hypothetical protein
MIGLGAPSSAGQNKSPFAVGKSAGSAIEKMS